MKILTKKDNLFISTRLKLDIIASFFVFFILFSFSFVVYKLLTQDIIFQISPVFKYLESKSDINSNNFFNDLQNQTLFLLIISDIIIFVLSIIFFDRMVKKMLMPIEYMINLQKSFSSNVSHELRTPLSIINMKKDFLLKKIERLKNKDLSNEDFISISENNLQEISNEIQNMTNIIDDLLFEARIKYAETKKEYIYINNLEEIINNVFEIQKNSKKENVKFIIENNIKNDNNLYFNVNKQHLDRVFNNLLSNSFKFTEKGEVKIILDIKKRFTKNYLSIKVEDTGIGINKEDIKKVGDRFFRARNIKDTTIGSGLGLSIVKEIINTNKWNMNILRKDNGIIIHIDNIILYE